MWQTVTFQVLGEDVKIWAGPIFIITSLAFLAVTAPLWFLIRCSFVGLHGLGTDYRSAYYCFACGQPKEAEADSPIIRAYYAIAFAEYVFLSLGLLVLSASFYLLTALFITRYYTQLAFLSFIPFMVVYFAPIFATKILTRLDKQSIAYVCRYEPTCSACAEDVSSSDPGVPAASTRSPTALNRS